MTSQPLQKISPQDLAAGIYPEGDVRNNPAVRKSIAESLASSARRALLPPVRRESFEQRLERIFWADLAKSLDKRLDREPYGDAYVLSIETQALLHQAVSALRKEITEWTP